MSRRALNWLAWPVAVLLTGPAAAQPQPAFYAGKTVKIVIGAGMGGEYGLYAQLTARHIGGFIPGKPTVIVQSMPGGGGVNALDYLANVAPQDGTVLALPHVHIVQVGMLDPKARFDPGKFQWIGRLADQLLVGVVSSRSGVRSLADARTKELIVGATAADNPSALSARILNEVAGTKFRIVTGYRSTQEIGIAWERGEVDVLWSGWAEVSRRYSAQLQAGLIVPLYVYAAKRPSDLAGVQTLAELGRNDAEKAFLQIYSIGTEIGRSLAAPPGVPRERVELWRAAYASMVQDPGFKAAVAKDKIRFDPLPGDRLAASVAEVVSLPAALIASAREFYDRLLAAAR
jgi:tripartite-type tricarboxylate transporter receptor subunit TctC